LQLTEPETVLSSDSCEGAASVAQLMKIRKQTIRESLSNFQGVEHRLEKVLKIQNVQYINDSKATNVNATFFALDSVTTPTVWIVGGVDKGNDYQELMGLVNEKVKAIICLGVDNKKIIDAFGSIVDVMVEVSSMTDAVKTAQHIAEKGDTVFLILSEAMTKSTPPQAITKAIQKADKN
jgi:UDP-N-acetylmuramoylalanine--D-glutamate ligase